MAAATVSSANIKDNLNRKKRKELCKWYLNNRCTRGVNCRFSHATEDIDTLKTKKVGTGKRLGKWKRDGLQSRARKRDWETYSQGIKPKYDVGDPNTAPKCKCGQVCVRRTVEKKKAKNFGKMYFSCPYWQDKKRNCAFFKWHVDGNSTKTGEHKHVASTSGSVKLFIDSKPSKKVKTGTVGETKAKDYGDDSSSDSSSSDSSSSDDSS